ncbi:STAS domain-containing protein [Trujillonella humicola]|uniref:STAS domain-containing protein n=1 Tax=Trujillonella humicola TaxID=3383699 RepID=UPI00390692B1
MDSALVTRSPGRRSMSEVVDCRRGSVRVSGDLTVQGADLLRGTVESLRRSGHDVVLVDLGDVRTTEAAGWDELEALRRSVSADGGELLLVAPPVAPAPAR